MSTNQIKLAARLDSIIDNLIGEILRAQLHFAAANALNEAYRNERVTAARMFFLASYYANLRESVLAIAKLVLPNRESITIKYLLDFGMSNPQRYRKAEEAEVKRMIARHRAKLDELESLTDRIKPIRDRDLAHFDKRRLTNPESVVVEPVNLSEIQDAINLLLEIVNDHDGGHRDQETYISHVRDFTGRDLDYILGLIEKADNDRKERLNNPYAVGQSRPE